MKRLLLALMIAMPLGAADKPAGRDVWTNEQISDLAATVYSQYRETQDVYTDGTRRNGDMRVVLNEEKECMNELEKNKSAKLAGGCMLIASSGTLITSFEMNKPYPTLRFYEYYAGEKGLNRVTDGAMKLGISKDEIKATLPSGGFDALISGMMNAGMR